MNRRQELFSKASAPRLRDLFLLLASVAVCCGIALTAFGQMADSGNAIEIRSFPSHSRLSIRLDEGTEPKLGSTREGFNVFLGGVGLSDLGAPLGEESAWASRFAGLHDARLASIAFREHDGGTEITGKWKTASKGARMELFDYKDRATSRYVLDFWVKEGPSPAQLELAKRRSDDARKQKDAENRAKARAERKLASDQAQAEAQDFDRFCREPMSAANDVILRFMPVHEPVRFGRWIPTTTPDSDFAYYQPTVKNEEGDYVRLALALYQEGKAALVIRTLDFFDRDFPKSNFSVEMKFLRANALLKLGMKDESEHLLTGIVSGSGGSPEALHAALYLAAHQMEQSRHLAALESFLWLIHNYPDHRLVWLFHLGAAEALLGIKQTDRAAKEYEWVSEYAPDSKARAEGSMREGDLYLQRFQYDQALAAYFHALHYFKDESREFPTVYLNRAESLYWLEQYDRAEEAFKDFLTMFPAFPGGWRAAIRLGEIHARRDAKQPSTEAKRWYSEAINRFPLSPGATLARLRLVPCGEHGGFDAAGAERFFEGEAAEFAGSEAAREELDLGPYRALRALTYVRAMASLGHEESAITAGIDELHGSGISEIRGTIGQMLEVMFRKKVIGLINQHDERKTIDALELYNQQGSKIPHTGIVDPDYLLKLSIAASDLGLAKQGEQLADAYRRTLSGGGAGDARKPASDAAAAEAPPGTPPATLKDADVETRMRLSEKNFAAAKAFWVAIHDAPAAEQTEKRAKVKELLSGVGEESPFFAESEIILGLIAEREGDLSQALRHAARAQLAASADSDSAIPDPQLEAWVARLQVKVGDPTVALAIYRNLENHFRLSPNSKSPTSAAATLGVAPVGSIEETVFAETEILEAKERWKEAADAYSRLIEAKQGGDHARFGYARALLSSGAPNERGRALAALEKITKEPASKSSGDDFWKKMAGEKLATEKNSNADASNAKEGVNP